ncbi:MAG: mechanosensitive ion channel domain-containing protein [Candidatus Zixiibacteriota bacterium]
MNPEKGVEDIWQVIHKILHFELFQLNKEPVTVLSIGMFVLMLALFYVASMIINRIIIRRIMIRLNIEKSTRYRMLRIGHYLIMISGTVVAFQFVGIDLGGLAVIFGLLSVGIGFGLQNITSNFIAGIILLFEQPIKVGDRVTVGDTEGNVSSINMRSTTIRTLNNISIIVPNSEFISSRVTNWSHGDPKIRLVVDVGVSYDSDPDAVIKALHEVAGEHPDVIASPEPDVLLSEFADSSWSMKLRVWLANPHRYYQIRSELNQAIVAKFRKYGIEIPYPQRDLHVRSPLPMPFVSRETTA